MYLIHVCISLSLEIPSLYVGFEGAKKDGVTLRGDKPTHLKRETNLHIQKRETKTCQVIKTTNPTHKKKKCENLSVVGKTVLDIDNGFSTLKEMIRVRTKLLDPINIDLFLFLEDKRI